MDLYKKQIELEEEMHGAGILRFTKNNDRAVDNGRAGEADWFRRLTREFVKPMADAIRAYQDYYEGRRGKPSATIGFLKCISPEAAAYITIKTIFDSMSGSKFSAQVLAGRIGDRIEDEIRFTKLSEAAPQYISAIRDSLKRRANQSYKFEHDSLVHAEKELKLLSDFQKLNEVGVDMFDTIAALGIDQQKYEQLLAKSDFAIDIDRWIPWSVSDCLQLGAKMIDIFANNMLLDGEPVIEKVTVSTGTISNRQTPAVIMPTEALEAWVEEYKEVMGSMSPAFEPCIIPPVDWTSPTNGGYHSKKVSSRLNLVKCKDKRHLRKLTKKQMPDVYEAVNGLQAVKWKINKGVLAVANEIRLKGLPLGMPSMDKLEKPACPVPAIYSELRGKELLQVLDEDQQAAFLQWKRDTVSYYSDEQKRRSEVREVVSTLAQGLKFKDFENLHFVYTLDFRSRVYAQGSLISPQGSDLQKSLIGFAESEKLGERGAYWLKVHGANVWGWDKETFDTRVSHCETEEFKDMCLDIAADPVSFTDWTKADKPWQFLAWCLEYAKLIEWVEDGNKEEDFESFIAVAMDGSCSGIQHYSAMLRDSVGGAGVNLVPSDKPQDIYGTVASVVRDWMQSIIEGYTQDVPTWDVIQEKFGEIKGYKFAEEWLRIQVTRNMTKKPVMTLPYGSSQLTCRDSISDYLSDIQNKADKQALSRGMPTGDVHCFGNKNSELPLNEAVSFASSLTWKAIGEVVIAARAAMKYIKSVTKAVAELGHSLQWPTPTGFIVDQTIFEVNEDKQVFTNMLGGCKFRVKEETKKIDVRRMISSCAPNFVHSMDASHLILSVCSFFRSCIKSVAVIHDSFGTHAGKTEELRHLLINSFVDMYKSHDVISDFKTAQEERLMVDLEIEEPVKGDLDLEDVRQSKYIFG